MSVTLHDSVAAHQLTFYSFDNICQILVALSTIIFKTEILPLNAAGIVVVLAGSAYYSYVSISDNNNKNNNSKKESSSTEVIKISPNRSSSSASGAPLSSSTQQVPLVNSIGDEENLIDDETVPLTGKKDTND